MRTPILMLTLFDTFVNILSNIDGLDTNWYPVGLLIRSLKRNVDIAFRNSIIFGFF